MNDKILQYLNNEMPLNEKQAFEEEIKHNDELKKEIALQENMDVFLNDLQEHNEIKTLVMESHEEFLSERKEKIYKINRLKWVAVAASVLLIIGVFIARSIVINQSDYIYSQNFAAYTPENIVRGNNIEGEFMQWNALYVKQEYTKVVEGFNALPTEYISNAKVIVMYSCALMETDNYKLALNKLNSANTNNRALVKADVTWYKALCYLKINELDKAIQELEKLITTSKIYSDDAEVLIEKLR